jgi:hypothetical protein
MSSWYDVMAAEEQSQTVRIIRMTPMEWKAETQRILRTARGDVRGALVYIRDMEVERASAAAASVPVEQIPVNRDLRVWRDMVEEPEKYGEDITEWLELDAKLRAGSGRWRVHAYWLEKEAALEKAECDAQSEWRAVYSAVARQAANEGMRAWAVRDIKRHVARFRKAIACIQSAVRGHQTRNRLAFRDCCMCLSHRICPLKTDVGMMCRECAEQGPHTDITGPVSDTWNWFRADYTDSRKWLACKVCESAPATDCVLGVWYCEDCLDDNQLCRECGDTFLAGTGPGMGFCDRECMQSAW